MKLKEFIKKLKIIAQEQGEDLEIVMADNIPVVDPVYSDKYLGKKVVITDEEPSQYGTS